MRAWVIKRKDGKYVAANNINPMYVSDINNAEIYRNAKQAFDALWDEKESVIEVNFEIKEVKQSKVKK